MNPDDLSISDGVDSSVSEDAEVARVLDLYLADLEAGRPADPGRLLAEHPAIAGQLRACLEIMHMAGRVAGGAVSGARDGSAAPSDAMARPLAPSLRATWNVGDGPPPHVHLHDLADDDEPLAMPRPPSMLATPEGTWGRYQLHGEIARGGMGSIIKGRDVDLGRDLAIKVLLESHRANPGLVRRFVEEAQIGGQLQHPGIVPVYELGTCADRRPYFAMKLVRGRTLASLLQARNGPRQDLPRFLAIYEQVCQTLAYAHARGVIHRDLKPSNVMAGSFGEVQVMDWGLAKVLARGGIADEAGAGAEPLGETVVMTVRTGPAGGGSESEAGSVLGTPAYMSPEQARGDVERLDERADVFGLGAILCEVLTGRPPYAGLTREEIRDRAARGDLAVAMGRLDACEADAELVALAKDCLTAERLHRPRDAGEVSRRMTAYQAGVQERLKIAELARVEAQTRAEEAHARALVERSRRRRTVALAAAVLGLVVLGGGGWAYLARQRLERAAQVDRRLGEVDLLYAEATRAGDDLTRWIAAREAARALEGLLGDAPDGPNRDRIIALASDVRNAAAAAETDRDLLAKLVEIRSAKGDDPDGTMTDAEYADAFRDAGLDLATLKPAGAGEKIQARPIVVRVALAAALDDWAAIRRGRSGDQAGARQLIEVASLADHDPWRRRLREVLQLTARPERLACLKDLATSARIEELPAVSLTLLGETLIDLGELTEAESVLRNALRRFPGDVWINLSLAQCLGWMARREEAIRYYVAARSLRPETAHGLAHALDQKGEADHAISVFEDLVKARPKEGVHLACLGKVLRERGRTNEAKAVLDAAVAVGREATVRQAGRPIAHFRLGVALAVEGNLDEAIAEYRAAIRLKPDFLEAYNNLAHALYDQGKLDEAIAACREALRLRPDFPEARITISAALYKKGSLGEAIAECREALRLRPNSPEAYNNLGHALYDRGEFDEAIAQYRSALRLNPQFSEVHDNLGLALLDQGRLDEAIPEFREAIRLKPNRVESHSNLGFALFQQGKFAGAIAEYREILRLNPDDALARARLGLALHQHGRFIEAMTVYREVLKRNPNDSDTHYNLGNLLRDYGKPDEAISEFRTAIRLRPAYAEAHCNLGHLIRQQGRYSEALAEFKRGHELGSKSRDWSYPSAHWVREAERLVELEARLPAILRKATSADAAEMLVFAQLCYEKGLHGASARLWADAFQSQPKTADDLQAQHRYNAACAAALAGCGPGQDDPPLDEAAKVRWRKQAIAWLKADLAARAKILETGPPQASQAISQGLQHWKTDADLAGIRDPGSVGKLPEDEQKACRALWAKVDALLAEARAGIKP